MLLVILDKCGVTTYITVTASKWTYHGRSREPPLPSCGLWCQSCKVGTDWLRGPRRPRFLSLLMTPALVNYISTSDQIQQITNQIRKFFWSPAAAQNFLPAAFYFHLWLFWNPAIKFPWFLVGISTIGLTDWLTDWLTHRLQTEDLLIFLSQQIKKVSVVIFQFLVPSCPISNIQMLNSKFIRLIMFSYPSWLAVIILYLLLLFSPGLGCPSPSSSPPPGTE